MDIKERYKRFKQWQREPYHYKNKQRSTVRCANCGTEFSDNYCPRCGQKADVGRVNWNTVRQSVALLWGLESRSLGYTLLQLLLRPGYLISDYISGRRQVSFPPVKMLFIVAIAYVLINQLFGQPDTGVVEASSFGEQFVSWVDENIGWGVMCYLSFVLLPTLLIFRYAPRHDHHTLPEGFFIQVFMSTIALLLSCLSFLSDWLILAFFVFYYVVAYQQLFGYRFWGTLWRIMVCLFVAFVLFNVFVNIVDLFITKKIQLSHEGTIKLAILVTLAIALVAVTHFINKKSEKKRVPQSY